MSESENPSMGLPNDVTPADQLRILGFVHSYLTLDLDASRRVTSAVYEDSRGSLFATQALIVGLVSALGDAWTASVDRDVVANKLRTIIRRETGIDPAEEGEKAHG